MHAFTAAFHTVMDSERNPLRALPKAQSFQIMSLLAFMWSTIFSAGIGTWVWFGELVALHMLILVGLLATGWTFTTAVQSMPRDLYRRSDGTAAHDDIWGA